MSVYDFVYKGKYTPERAAGIDKGGKNITVKLDNRQEYQQINKYCQWVRGIRLDVKNEILATWSKEYVCFHHSSGKNKGNLVFSPIKDLVEHDVEITDLVINMEYRYYYNSTS